MLSIALDYLKSRDLSWSESTKRSERSRLLSIISYLVPHHPEILWKAIEHFSPYTRTTYWTRVVVFVDWAIRNERMQSPNSYKIFKDENRRLFKYVYQRKFPTITFEEAKERIQNISDQAIKRKALEILYSGLRWKESFTYCSSTSSICGKGNKPRIIYKPEIPGPDYKKSYATFLRAIKRIGIKPHDLRKLAATFFYKQGLDEFTLLSIMGWEKLDTARAYIKPTSIEEVKTILEKIAA